MDIDTLQSIIKNVTYATVVESELPNFSMQRFVHLFHIMQMILQYVLHTQVAYFSLATIGNTLRRGLRVVELPLPPPCDAAHGQLLELLFAPSVAKRLPEGKFT